MFKKQRSHFVVVVVVCFYCYCYSNTHTKQKNYALFSVRSVSQPIIGGGDSKARPLQRSTSSGTAFRAPTAVEDEKSKKKSAKSSKKKAAEVAEEDESANDGNAPFIGALLVHRHTGLAREASHTLQAIVSQEPHTRAAIVASFVSLVADYNPIDTPGLLVLLRNLVALLDCWRDRLRVEKGPLSAASALSPTVLVQLDALAFIHLCSIDYGVRRTATYLVIFRFKF